ncbi:MAG: class I SAM-dependent methyltransferase [Acidimicrobiales bacterium]
MQAKIDGRTTPRRELSSAGLQRAALRMLQRAAVPATRAALKPPTGQVTLTEARFLSELCRELPEDSTIVEIGTLFGYSTRVIALAKPQSAKLVTVDAYSWNPLCLRPSAHRRVTAELLEESVRDFNVSVVAADKDDFYASYRGPAPALIFLDADHGYEPTKRDIEWATSFPGALVCVHDYTAAFPGVMRAVDESGGPARLVGTLCTLDR